MSGGWDELLGQAQEGLREQAEENDLNAHLGDEMTPEPEQHFAGRWRGEGQMLTRDRGLVDVFLVWDRNGEPGFLYRHTRLVREVEAEQPQPGDRVIVLRGLTETFEVDGEERSVYPYVLRREPCDDPLPETSGPEPDIPF